MRYMFMMNHRMTIWAYYKQIIQFVIMSIFINMMNAKNFFTLIKTAFLTFFKHTTANHIFTNSAKNCFPCFFRFFVYTFFGAIFSASGWGIKKFFMAMSAFMFNLIIVVRWFTINSLESFRFSFIKGKFICA